DLYSGTDFVGRPAWFPDGRSLVATFVSRTENRGQLWFIDYPGSERHRFTNDLSTYGIDIDLTHDGQLLAGTLQHLNSHIFVAPESHLDQVRQLTFGE